MSLFADFPDPEPNRVVCQFSAGVSSAVATKLALVEFPNAIVIRFRIGGEHPDTERFSADCEKWFGRKIEIITPKYESHWDVIEKVRYIRGPHGAPCTRHLKIFPGEAFRQSGDLSIFGYDADEKDREQKLRDNVPSLWFRCPLIESGLVKEDCKRIVERAGIRLPEMYLKGYSNNNCIGCVKGGMGYWNKIRVDFPEVFQRMSALEQSIGASIHRHQSGPQKGEKLFLADLPPDAGRFEEDEPTECGALCELTLEKIGIKTHSA